VGTGYRERRIGERERECVVVLSGGELDGGRRLQCGCPHNLLKAVRKGYPLGRQMYQST